MSTLLGSSTPPSQVIAGPVDGTELKRQPVSRAEVALTPQQNTLCNGSEINTLAGDIEKGSETSLIVCSP